MKSDEHIIESEAERLTRLCCPFGSGDVQAAVRFALEFGISAEDLIRLAEDYVKNTGTPFDKLDIVYIAYEHIMQDARNKVYEATGFDFINDAPGSIYTYGNCMATCYDYTEEARHCLIEALAGLDREEREELLNENLLRFLEYINIMQADIDEMAESINEEKLLSA